MLFLFLLLAGALAVAGKNVAGAAKPVTKAAPPAPASATKAAPPAPPPPAKPPAVPPPPPTTPAAKAPATPFAKVATSVLASHTPTASLQQKTQAIHANVLHGINARAAITPDAKVQPATDRLLPGQSLRPGGRIVSPNGRAEFKLQDDGNSVLKDLQTGGIMWASATYPGGHLQNPDESSFGWSWSTNPDEGGGKAVLVTMQTDGNLVWIMANGAPLGARNTTGSGGGSDLKASAGAGAAAGGAVGSVVPGVGSAIGAGLGAGVGALYAVMGQRASDHIKKGSYLVVQNDGNLVIYAPDGSVVWATGTDGFKPGLTTDSVYMANGSPDPTRVVLNLMNSVGPEGVAIPLTVEELAKDAGLDPSQLANLLGAHGTDAKQIAQALADFGVTPGSVMAAAQAVGLDPAEFANSIFGTDSPAING